MEREINDNIIIRTYEPRDKEGTYSLFRISLQSVINYGKLNYKIFKLIFLNFYEKSKYTILLILLFLIVNLKILIIDLFNNNTFYYYVFTVLIFFMIWLIFSIFFLKFQALKTLNNYIDNSLKTDFKNPEEWLREGVSHLWVASLHGEIVGSIGVIPFEKEKNVYKIETNGQKVAELKRMYVLPSHQRKGIASKLYKQLENWCINNCYDEIVLSTSCYQVDGISFYKNNGFKVTNTIISGYKFPNFVILKKCLKFKKLE